VTGKRPNSVPEGTRKMITYIVLAVLFVALLFAYTRVRSRRLNG
jgi:hypothetical protein